MKKVIVNTAGRITAILLLCFTAMNVCAFTGKEDGQIDYNLVVSNPSFWIGVVLFIGFITAALLVDRKDQSAHAE